MLTVNEVAKTLSISNVRLKQILKEKDLKFERKEKSGKIQIPHGTVGELFKNKGLSIKPEILSFFLLKGGVGKTVLNVNYAVWLAQRSTKPVLLCDFDGESCASNMLLKKDEDLDDVVTIYEVLKNDLQIKDYAIKAKYDNLYILPARMKAMKSERLATNRNPKTLLRNYMKGLEDKFSFIIFDMPPTLNSLTTSALLTLTKLVTPINSDVFSIESLHLTMDMLRESSKEYETELPELRVLMNKYQANTIASSESYKEVIANFANELIPVPIKLSASVNNATNEGLTVHEFCSKEVRNNFDEIFNSVANLNIENEKVLH